MDPSDEKKNFKDPTNTVEILEPLFFTYIKPNFLKFLICLTNL